MLQHNVILRFSEIGIDSYIIHLESAIFILQCLYLNPINWPKILHHWTGTTTGSTMPWLDMKSYYLSIRLFERPIRHFPIRTGDLISGIRLKLGSFSELWNLISWNRFRSNKINSVNCSFSTFNVIISENQLWSSCGRLSLKQYADFRIRSRLDAKIPSVADKTVQIPAGIPEGFRNHEWVLSKPLRRVVNAWQWAR